MHRDTVFAHRRASLLATATAVAAATGWATTARNLRCRTRELHRAQRDLVTGLLNRGAWDRAAGLAWTRHDSVIGLADLDRFKQINDRYGHDAGDIVLRTVAARLAAALGPAAIAGRYGGDELVWVARKATTSVERLRAALTGPVSLPCGTQLDIGVSVGTSNPGHARVDDAVTEADHAMYQHKHQERHHV